MLETPKTVLLGCSDQDADTLRHYLSHSECVKDHGRQLTDQLTQNNPAVLIDVPSLGLEACNAILPSALSRGIAAMTHTCTEEQNLGFKACQEDAVCYLVVDQISSSGRQQALRYTNTTRPECS
jgi:hypothetical protein